MSRFRKVDAGTWGDAQFMALSDDARLLWFRLLTGPEVTSLPGLLLAGRAQLAEAMGWALVRFDRAFAVLAQPKANGEPPMAKADWAARLVWLPKAHVHNRPANPNVIRGWRDQWRCVPESVLKTEALGVLKRFAESLGEPFAEAFAMVSGTVRETVSETVQVTVPALLGERSLACARAAPAPASESDPDLTREAPKVVGRPPARPGAVATAPPATIEVTEEVRANCSMAGAPMPDAEHVVACLAHARSQGTLSHDWGSVLVKWMVQQKSINARARERDVARIGPPGPTVVSPASKSLDRIADERRRARGQT